MFLPWCAGLLPDSFFAVDGQDRDVFGRCWTSSKALPAVIGRSDLDQAITAVSWPTKVLMAAGAHI